MPYQTTIQCIQRRAGSRQWYVPLPAALAETLDLAKGEPVAWALVDRRRLVLQLIRPTPSPLAPVHR